MPITRRALLKQAGLLTMMQLAPLPAWPTTEKIRFGLMGDRTGKATPGVYEAVAIRIITEKPEFIINIGDSIEGRNEATAEAEWAEMQAIWKVYGSTPHYFTPGNHDIWSDWSENLYTRITGFNPRYSFTHKACHITVLDNSRSGALDDTEVEFLRQDLREHRDVPLKMIFFHKPYWLPFMAVGSGEFELHRLCREYGVRMVISGHLHRLLRYERDDVCYACIGSSGGTIAGGVTQGGGFENGWFYQYGVMEASAEGLSLTIEEMPAPLGQGRVVSLDDWRGERLLRKAATARFPAAPTFEAPALLR
jgi:predicted phosphodiesterase